jgi:hypothetical protein
VTQRPASLPPKYLNPIPFSAEVIPGANADFDPDLALDEEILRHSRMTSDQQYVFNHAAGIMAGLSALHLRYTSARSLIEAADDEESVLLSPGSPRRQLPALPGLATMAQTAAVTVEQPTSATSLARRHSIREAGRRSRHLSEERRRERRLWARLSNTKLTAPTHAPEWSDATAEGENDQDSDYEAVAIGASDASDTSDSVSHWLQQQHQRHVAATRDKASSTPRVFIQHADTDKRHGARFGERQPLAAIDELHESISLIELA